MLVVGVLLRCTYFGDGFKACSTLLGTTHSHTGMQIVPLRLFRVAYILLSYCAIAAAFFFKSLCNFILGGSKMGL